MKTNIQTLGDAIRHAIYRECEGRIIRADNGYIVISILTFIFVFSEAEYDSVIEIKIPKNADWLRFLCKNCTCLNGRPEVMHLLELAEEYSGVVYRFGTPNSSRRPHPRANSIVPLKPEISERGKLSEYPQLAVLLTYLLGPAMAGGLSEEQGEAIYNDLLQRYSELTGDAFWPMREEILRIINMPDREFESRKK